METPKIKTFFSVMAIGMLSLILFNSTSCKKIFEEDLSAKSIVINMPNNNFISSNSTLQFWWEEVDGASTYLLQIVKPSFDTIITLVVDSNVSGNKFNWSFSPGKYQWRIKACNSAGCSNFQVYNLEIDSSLDLSNSSTILLSPNPNIYTNKISIEFRWLKQYYADYYYFSVFDNNNIPIIYNESVYTDFIYIPGQNIVDTLKEGYFKWEITAENANSTGITSSSNFTIDRTNPDIPTLVKPTNNYMQSSKTIDFQWVSGSDLNYSYDSLFVYLDSTMISIFKSYKLTQNTLSDSLNSGSYYWFVKTIDKAGNKSHLSEIRKFIIN